MIAWFVLPWLMSASASLALVDALRRYAIHRDVLDHPGARSSHAIPTPRGGGAGLVLSFGAVFVLLASQMLDSAVALALVGVCFVALVGWIDDHRFIRVRTRLVVHLAGAMGLVPLVVSGQPTFAAIGVAAWWVFCGVASINAINFMDGIDGLIGWQAMIMGGYYAWLAPHNILITVFGTALSGSSAGFLVWNWPRARIFMGDVGSGAVGLLLVVGGALVIRSGSGNLLRAFLPLTPVVLDAAWTLGRRAIRGERVTEAHRQHLYQRMANGSVGHPLTTLCYATAAATGALIGAQNWNFAGVLVPCYGVIVVSVYLLGNHRWPVTASRR